MLDEEHDEGRGVEGRGWKTEGRGWKTERGELSEMMERKVGRKVELGRRRLALACVMRSKERRLRRAEQLRLKVKMVARQYKSV